MQVWTSDGPGVIKSSRVEHGRTFLYVEGDYSTGWYDSVHVSGWEDHSEELLADLPESGANLPYDPSPRYYNPGEATIEPIHELPENLESTNSTKNIHNDPDIMVVFPSDSHAVVTPYHTSTYEAALYSLGDIVNPDEHNAEEEPILGDTSDEHDYFEPFATDPFTDDFSGDMSNNDNGTLTEPTTEQWLSNATSFWPTEASADPRGGVRAPRVHFSDLSETVDQHWDNIASPETLDGPFHKTKENWNEGETDEPAEVSPHESSFDFLSGVTVIADDDDSNSGESHYKYVKKRGDKWVIIQKGTGKVLSEHDSKEKAEAAFRAMEMNMHSSTKVPDSLFNYLAKLESNSSFRESKWKDVKEKAVRLRREGAVSVTSFTPFQCRANVQGDSGYYSTEVNRSNAFGKAVSFWDCDCPWGKWAYKRERDYVGRMCSHAYATYMEMQSLDNKKQKDPFGYRQYAVHNTPQGWFVSTRGGQNMGPYPTEAAAEEIEEQVNGNNGYAVESSFGEDSDYRIGDVVAVTQHGLGYDQDNRSISLVPGDLGTIASVPNRSFAEVALYDDPYGSPVKIPFDCLERHGFYNFAEVETNDDSEDNVMDAGAFSDDLPTLLEGIESEDSQAKDNPTSFGTLADYADTDHEHDCKNGIDIYSDEEENDKPGENDRLRSLTSYDDLYGEEVPHEGDYHFADATGDDEMDNPSTETPNTSMSGGPEDESNVVSEDNSTTAHFQATGSLDWLKEANSSANDFVGFDPNTVARITKHGGKDYKIMEQVALMTEPGSSSRVDHLNIAGTWYEDNDNDLI